MHPDLPNGISYEAYIESKAGASPEDNGLTGEPLRQWLRRVAEETGFEVVEADDKPWRADIHERINDVGFLADLGPDTYFKYVWNHGYEEVVTAGDNVGSSHYAGAYHPYGGFCTNGRADAPDDDFTGICIYCGRTLH